MIKKILKYTFLMVLFSYVISLSYYYLTFDKYDVIEDKNITPELKHRLRNFITGEDDRPIIEKMEKQGIDKKNSTVWIKSGKELDFKEFSEIVDINEEYVCFISGPWDFLSGYRFFMFYWGFYPNYTNIFLVDLDDFEVKFKYRIKGVIDNAVLIEDELYFRTLKNTCGKIKVFD